MISGDPDRNRNPSVRAISRVVMLFLECGRKEQGALHVQERGEMSQETKV
jgi:hypothetical protein